MSCGLRAVGIDSSADLFDYDCLEARSMPVLCRDTAAQVECEAGEGHDPSPPLA